MAQVFQEIKMMELNGKDVYFIEEKHSFADILKWLIDQGSDKTELHYLLDHLDE